MEGCESAVKGSAAPPTPRKKRFYQRPSPRGLLPTVEEMWPVLALEVTRARRYGRPFTVMAVEDSGAFRAAFRSRLTDLVVCSPRDGLLIVAMPETDADAAARAVQRVASEARHAIAAFPADAPTLDGLIEILRAAWRTAAVPG